MDQTELQNQIDDLKRRLDEKDRQQITYPLDIQSIQVLNNYFMRLNDVILTTGGVGGIVTISFIGTQNQLKTSNNKLNVSPARFVVSENTYVPYTVNTTSNIISIVPGNRFQFVDDETVYFQTEDTLPSPLGAGTYYVINAAADGKSFKVSASLGGAEVNITDTGTGKQYVFYL